MNDEQKLKLKFAEAWLRNPNNAYAAALSVAKNNPFLATQICDKFLNDSEVEAFKKSLIDDLGEEHFLPSKCEMIREVYDRAKICLVDESYVKLMKLAADMRGFIEKPGITVNNLTQTNNRVMMIPSFPTNQNGVVDADYWESVAIGQQKSITE
jgi:hypothetical protein